MKKVLMTFNAEDFSCELVRMTTEEKLFYRVRTERATRGNSVPYEDYMKAREAFLKAVDYEVRNR